MPVPDGATRVTYNIASGSVDQPLQVILPVELSGDMEFLDGAIEEAVNLLLTRIREDRPGDPSITVSRLYDCTVPDATWPPAE
ncbi:hypothetical protein ABZ069_31925 [Streptomyces microflavus]|uniref:hypothetical protein n=1 Tax=Streptomyces microflavus TaxID=1919 RepID=UPI0033A74C54